MSATALSELQKLNVASAQTNAEQPGKRLYKCTRFGTTVYLPNGKPMHFKFGKYATDNAQEIAFLDNAVANNEFGGQIYIDPNARTLSEEEENPMKALERQIIEKYKAEMAAATDPKQNFGSYVQGTLRPASTSDIAAVAAGGDGAARLTNSSKTADTSTKV